MRGGAWGEEVKPSCLHLLPRLPAQPAKPTAEVAHLFGRSERKYLSGFPVFSGLFLRITIFGLEK